MIKKLLIIVALSLGLVACGASNTTNTNPPNSETTENTSYTVLPEDTPVVKIGIWKTEDCSGDPVMTLVFPTNYTDQQCYAWPGNSGENSATNFRCGDNSFSYTQWTSLTCSGGYVPDGTAKTVYTDQCEQDIPPTIYSRIVDFSGCETN